MRAWNRRKPPKIRPRRFKVQRWKEERANFRKGLDEALVVLATEVGLKLEK